MTTANNKPDLVVLNMVYGTSAPRNFTGVVAWSNGSKTWYKDGEFHRDDGPAVEWYNGTKSWWLNGKRHREDGAAVVRANGKREWWLDGANYTKTDWKNLTTKLNAKPKTENNMSKEQTVFKAAWGWKPTTEFSGCVEFPDQNKYWHKNGKLHREDGPAIEWVDGSKEWWLNGGRHRVNGPAIEWANGTKQWWLNGERHREDGPAYEGANGYKEWWLNGTCYSEENWKKEVAKLKPEPIVIEAKTKLDIPAGFTGITKWPSGARQWWMNGKCHREDGPAYEAANGDKFWYLNGESHREDGPAIEWNNGSKGWWLNDDLHRVDGPAIEHANGTKEWWLNGKNYSEENWKKEVAKLNVKPAEEAKTMETKQNALAEFYFHSLSYVSRGFTGIAKFHNGDKNWFINGSRHREDGPAIERVNGDKEWFKNNQRHREDGPAIERANGDKEWWVSGKRHREDGPAFEYANGHESWYLNGACYSEENWKKEVAKLNAKPEEEAKAMETKQEPAVIKVTYWSDAPKDFTGIVEYFSGTKEWWLNGKAHREDGPARVFNDGSKVWFLNGKIHREDGPAYEGAAGTRWWFLNGLEYSEATWKEEILKLNADKSSPASKPNVVDFLNKPIKFADVPTGNMKHPTSADFQVGKTTMDLLLTVPEGVASIATVGGIAGEILSPEPTKENPKMSIKEKIVATAKSDAKEVAKRVAVAKLTDLVQQGIIAMMTSQLKGKQKASMVGNLKTFFESENGRTLIQFCAGAGLPFVLTYIPEKYHNALNVASTELRIQAETQVGMQVADMAMMMMPMLTSGLMSQLDSLVGSEEATPTRIDVGTTSSHVGSESEEHGNEVAYLQSARR
jgi:hypothetical protein